MAHCDVREGKWRGNWRMEWVASTLHTTSQHGVSSITTADAHTSAASSRLNWRARRFKCTRPFRRKTKSGFCACAITFQLVSNIHKFHVLPTCSVHLCVLHVCASEQTVIISPYINNWLVFITETECLLRGTDLLHGAESFLRSYPVLRQSTKSPCFAETQSSLPHSQVPATCLYSGPDQCSPCLSILLPEDPS